MARIQGILFDLGDTILDFGPINTLALFARGARLAYRYLQQLHQPLPPFRKFHRHQLAAVRWHYLKSHLTRREFDSLEVLGGLARKMGHDLTDSQMEELAWLWYEPLGRCVTIEQGLHDILADFRRGGVRLGVVSNTFVPGAVLDRHLDQLELLEYFPTRIYSCDVRYRKPDPKIFRIAMDRAALPPGATMFVGDKLLADVRGASRAGMIAVLKDPTGARRRRGIRPAHRIASLRELPGIVAGYNEAADRGGGPD